MCSQTMQLEAPCELGGGCNLLSALVRFMRHRSLRKGVPASRELQDQVMSSVSHRTDISPATEQCSLGTPRLPYHIILHILSLLPDADKAWSARLVSKAAHQEFRQHERILLNSSDLPLAALQTAYYLRHFEDAAASRPIIPHYGASQLGEVQLAAARAACGDLVGLQWLHSQSCPWDSWVSEAAAAGGHAAVLQWARSQRPPCPWGVHTCIAAAEGGHLAVLQWARAQKPPCPWDKRVCSHAARSGQLHVLQWARAQKCPWGSDTCYCAAQAGQLGVLQWAWQHHCPWDSKVCSYAARGGHLEVLQWAREHHCPWDGSVCSAAAKAGHLHILQWARAQEPPCPWDSGVCKYAVRGGQLAVLQWARMQDPPCPWNKQMCELEAEALGHQHVVEWVRTVDG